LREALATKQSIYPLCRAVDCFAPLALTVEAAVYVIAHWNSVLRIEESRICAMNFFIISVDRMFTTLVERPFTNAFDASRASRATTCVCRTRHAD